MKKSKLGKSGIEVSRICLGTMTWGEQNTQDEAFEQMDFAVENGINFFDTAELYPVPPKKDTYTRTEVIIGNWFAERKMREQVVLASKVVGPSGLDHIRGGQAWLNKQQITDALHASLKRLQTDYLDLYQLHWPNRQTTFFGTRGYKHNPRPEDDNFQEVLSCLSDFVKQGKIRTIGLSNETPWGTMKYLELARTHHLEPIVSIQNPYNLLNRTYESGMAEVSMRESAGLLAYSPLGFGVLTGKYLQGKVPSGSRLEKFGNHFSRYTHSIAQNATAEYVKIAKKNELNPTQMALAFVNGREFLTANIIGATSIAQLKENIGSIRVELSDHVIEEIEKVHTRYPNPCP